MSPRRSTVAPIAPEVNALLDRGDSDASIARLTGRSEDAIRRYRIQRQARGTDSAAPSQIQELLSECDRLAEMAQDDTRGSIQLLAQRIRLLEVAARAPVQQQIGPGFVRVGSIEFLDEIVAFAEKFGMPCAPDRMRAALSRIAQECPHCAPIAEQALSSANTEQETEQESTHVTN